VYMMHGFASEVSTYLSAVMLVVVSNRRREGLVMGRRVPWPEIWHGLERLRLQTRSAVLQGTIGIDNLRIQLEL
jgi:hypothetical protein